MVNEPILIIMAAGMGSRFGGLKQMTPVSGDKELILDFSLYDAMMAGFKKAVLVIKRENEEDFRKLLEGRSGKFMEIDFAYQELSDLPEGAKVPEGRVKPWGTGHAVLAARSFIDGPFAVINADDYYGPTAFQMIYDFLSAAEDKKKYSYAMVGFRIENTLTENGFVSRGVCRSSDSGLLEEITERTKISWHGEEIGFSEEDEAAWTTIPRGTPVSMNFWGFTKSLIDEAWSGFGEFLTSALKENPLKGEYYLPAIVDRLIKEGKAQVKLLNSPDRWYGVTYKEDTEGVVSALQSMKDKGMYPEALWK